MLSRLTASDVPAFMRACAYERVFGSRALAALRAYGLGSGHARFYLCQKGREVAAAFYLDLDSRVLFISSDERADPLPVAGLVRQEGVRVVHTNHAQAEALQGLLGGTLESSYFMVYRGAQAREDYPDIVPGELSSVFDVLRRSHEHYRAHLQFDRWAAGLQCRLQHGLAELYQLERDGQVAATGCISSEDDECGVLSAVAVVPEFRGQGLGSRISRFLIQRVREKGKTPRLTAGYDEVAGLYRQLGFAPCGRWGRLYL